MEKSVPNAEATSARRYQGWLPILSVMLAAAACPARAAGRFQDQPSVPSAQSVAIDLSFRGAVHFKKAYRHAIDADHRCQPALEIMPSPEPGSTFSMIPFTVLFSSSARAGPFALVLKIFSTDPTAGEHRGSSFSVSITANNRTWTGESAAGVGEMITGPNGFSGKFDLPNLTSPGTSQRLGVRGTWNCLAP